MYSVAFGWNVWSIFVKSICSNMFLRADASLLIFCLNDLSTNVSDIPILLLHCCLFLPLGLLIFTLIFRYSYVGYLGFSCGSAGKGPTCQYRRRKTGRFNPGSRRSPGEGNDNLFQYSCLENCTAGPGGLWSIGSQRVGHHTTYYTTLHTRCDHMHILCIP